MRVTGIWGLAIAALMLGGCAGGGLPDQAAKAGPLECVALFQRFDQVERLRTTVFGRDDDRTVDPMVLRQGQILRQRGCLTGRSALSTDDTAPPVAAGGGRIMPIAVHAGVVTNMADDRRMKAHFQTLGFRARSVGSAALGRRIYLGPVATDAELARAMEAARRAGFSSPYSARF